MGRTDDDGGVVVETDRPGTDVTGVVQLFHEDGDTQRHGAMSQLVCVAGADLGRTFRVAITPITIGRSSGVDVLLRASDVSRQHARITRSREDLEIEDLGSANGTYVNGAPIAMRTTLRMGDRIQLGSTILVLAPHDQLEERMRQLQRLEAMSAMAGGLAHDFNNALTVILGTLELLELKLGQRATDVRDMLDDMREAGGSASALAKRLLRLGRAEHTSYERIDLAPFVDKMVATMRRQAKGSLTITANVGEGLGVHGSYEELHQVLLNLFLNARDAMPNGGSLRIDVRAVTFDLAGALKQHLAAAGDYVELVVADTGAGMDEATLGRIFEPFFTTKPPGHGTGLGLAMIHGIVRRHGGSITADSAPGRGTRLRILLPRI